jgi:hypothetical protein
MLEVIVINIIYEENNIINVDLIDFEQSEYLWNQCYNFTNVNIYNDIVDNKKI